MLTMSAYPTEQAHVEERVHAADDVLRHLALQHQRAAHTVHHRVRALHLRLEVRLGMRLGMRFWMRFGCGSNAVRIQSVRDLTAVRTRVDCGSNAIAGGNCQSLAYRAGGVRDMWCHVLNGTGHERERRSQTKVTKRNDL